MHPVLFEIPLFNGIKIHSYGLMMAVGFLAALLWIRFRSRRDGLSVQRMTDLAFLMVVVAVVGSRLAYIAEEWRQYLADPMGILRVWEGGLVFHGGLIACVIVAWFYMKKHALPFWKVSDVFAPGIAVGHAFGRVGCFLAGCCHGLQCDPNAWYGVRFPKGVGSLAPVGVALYPTQLMEALAEFLIFFLLAWKSSKKAFDGQILLLYLILYPAFRVFVEFYRSHGEVSGILSQAQWVAIALVLIGVILFIYRRGRSS